MKTLSKEDLNPTGGQVWELLSDQVSIQIWDQIQGRGWSRISDQVRDQVWRRIANRVWDQIRSHVIIQILEVTIDK